MSNTLTEMYKHYRQVKEIKEQAQLQAELERERRIQGSLWNPQPGQTIPVHTLTGVISPYQNVAQQEPAKPSITIDHPAMQATLDELSNLWAAKFGDVWVSVEKVEDDDAFWSIAAKRLLSKGYLEFFPELRVYRLCK